MYHWKTFPLIGDIYLLRNGSRYILDIRLFTIYNE